MRDNLAHNTIKILIITKYIQIGYIEHREAISIPTLLPNLKREQDLFWEKGKQMNDPAIEKLQTLQVQLPV